VFHFFIFCHSICHPQTIIRRPPHTFRHNRVSSMMIPSLLTLTFGWLSHLTSERLPPKAKTPSLSLIFDGSRFGAPSKGTSHSDCKPATRRLLWTHGESWCQDLGAPLPYSWRERAKPQEGRVAAAHLDVVSCGWWVVGCGLWVVLWACECSVLRYQFFRPPRLTFLPTKYAKVMKPPQR
jgi:hypothetical protein